MASLLRRLPPPSWEAADGWERIRALTRLQHRLTRLCAMSPDRHAAPPCTVLASFAWWRGDGTLARIALERALRCDGDYRLAQLLQLMVEQNIRVPAA